MAKFSHFTQIEDFKKYFNNGEYLEKFKEAFTRLDFKISPNVDKNGVEEIFMTRVTEL